MNKPGIGAFTPHILANIKPISNQGIISYVATRPNPIFMEKEECGGKNLK